jgi:hypothetical protein
LRFEKAKEARDNSGIHDGMSSERNGADHSQEGIGVKAKNSRNALEMDQSARGRHRDTKTSWKGAVEEGRSLLVSSDMQIGLLQTLKTVRIQGRRGVRTTIP